MSDSGLQEVKSVGCMIWTPLGTSKSQFWAEKTLGYEIQNPEMIQNCRGGQGSKEMNQRRKVRPIRCASFDISFRCNDVVDSLPPSLWLANIETASGSLSNILDLCPYLNMFASVLYIPVANCAPRA